MTQSSQTAIDLMKLFCFLATWNNKRDRSQQSQQNDLCAWRRLRSAWASALKMSIPTHKAHSEDSDQTGRIPRRICVFFAGRTCHFVSFAMLRLITTFFGEIDIISFLQSRHQVSWRGNIPVNIYLSTGFPQINAKWLSKALFFPVVV